MNSVAAERLEFAPPPTPGLLRALVLAILAHAVLMAALTWGVHWKRSSAIETAEAELWASVPQPAAPPPPPEPVAAPTPPAPPAVQAPPPPAPDPDIALEQEKRRLQKEKQQQAERLEQDKREKQRKVQEAQRELAQQRELEKRLEADRQKAALEARRKDELKAQQEANRKLEQQREANMRRLAGLAGSAGAPSSTGTAAQAAGPSAGYAGRVAAAVRRNIVYTETPSGNPEALIEVRAAPDGTIVSRKLLRSSGVKSWDEAVLKAIDRMELLPRDTDGRVPPVLEIVSRPRD